MSLIRRWVAVASLAVLSAAVAYYAQVRIDDLRPGARLRWGPVDAPAHQTWLWIGLLATVLAVGLPLLEGARAARAGAVARAEAVNAEARRQEVVDSVLSPFANLLGQLSDIRGAATGERARLHAEAKTVLLAGLTDLLGGAASVRATFFELEEGAPRRLVSRGFYGRPDEPRRSFTAGEEAGDAALGALDHEEARYWRQDRDLLPPGWTRQRSYRTFIAVPVATKAHLLGMLTVDATTSDAFTDGDVTTAVLLARLLAAALNR